MDKEHLFRFRWLIPGGLLLLTVISVGWFLTDYLGKLARQSLIDEGEASALTLSVYFTSEFHKMEGAVAALSGSPWVHAALLSRSRLDLEQAEKTLSRFNSALGTSVSYVLNTEGRAIASSNRNDPDSFLNESYGARPYFTEALKGHPSRYFGLGLTSGKRGFYTSHPVYETGRRIAGVVVMKKDLDEMDAFLQRYPHCFLIDPHGVVFLSSRPAMLFNSLWPIGEEVRQGLLASRQFGDQLLGSIMEQEVTDGQETLWQGARYYTSRKMINPDGWSVVLLTSMDEVHIYRWIGILSTLFVCLMIFSFFTVIYFIDRSKQAVELSETLYKTLAEKSFAGVYVVQGGRFSFINANAAGYAGYRPEELVGKGSLSIVHPDDAKAIRGKATKMLMGMIASPYEFRIVTKDGQVRWIMETVAPIHYEGKPAILGNSMDISDRKQMEEEILALTITDSLTGLYNRRGFLTLAEQQLKLAERTKRGVLLLFADVDDMKRINDSLGHKKGDEALMETAEILKSVFRESDIIARIGGDEFAILALEAPDETVDIVMERLQNELDLHNARQDRRYRIAISIGTSYYDPENPFTIDDLMTQADERMYDQKRSKQL